MKELHSYNEPLCFIYDRTFEGLLTCIFDAYNQKHFPDDITYKEKNNLFYSYQTIHTDPNKADRVLKGLEKKISKSALQMLFVCWLSELDGIEILIFNYIKKCFNSTKSIELNFADPDVLELSKIYQKVKKEEEHARQFVRFQKTADQIYFACFEPRYNVLPLSREFFEDRFADQTWIIYDIKRGYALYYDLEKTEVVTFDDLDFNPKNGLLRPEQMSEEEGNFQEFWRAYLKSITIKERLNLKLQRQHMPKRFWKFLIEKQ